MNDEGQWSVWFWMTSCLLPGTVNNNFQLTLWVHFVYKNIDSGSEKFCVRSLESWCCFVQFEYQDRIVHAPSLFKYFLLQGSCLTRVFRPLILRKAKGENVHEPNSCCLRNIKRHKQRKRNRGCAGCVYNKRRNRQIRPWSVLFLHYYLCLCQNQDWDQCLQPFLCLEPQLHLNLDPFLRTRRKITNRILERSQKWVNYDCYS